MRGSGVGVASSSLGVDDDHQDMERKEEPRMRVRRTEGNLGHIYDQLVSPVEQLNEAEVRAKRQNLRVC